MACGTLPARISSGRKSSGIIGSPAASAEVQPAGRMAFELRSQTAPEPAAGVWPLVKFCKLYSSKSLQLLELTTSAWRSLPLGAPGPPSINVFWSMGKPPAGWSLSVSYANVGVTPVVGGGATLIGIPYCCANVPRSGCRFAFCAMLPFQVALMASTGRPEMSVLRMLSAGNREQLVPGTAAAAAGIRPVRRVPAAKVSAHKPAIGSFTLQGLTAARLDVCARRT